MTAYHDIGNGHRTLLLTADQGEGDHRQRDKESGQRTEGSKGMDGTGTKSVSHNINIFYQGGFSTAKIRNSPHTAK
jgi:hypothetical protein